MRSPSSCALISSGLSSRACIPNMTASRSGVIFSGYHPHWAGRSPAFSNLPREGSKISSSEPLTWYPFSYKAKARLCIALPPMAIKCIFIGFCLFCISCLQSKRKNNKMVKFGGKMIVRACILLGEKRLGNRIKICGKQYCYAG